MKIVTEDKKTKGSIQKVQHMTNILNGYRDRKWVQRQKNRENKEKEII